MSKYPRAFKIETLDGEGEAIKSGVNEPWSVSYPTGGFRWHGSVAEVQAEARKRLLVDYGEAVAVTFLLSDEGSLEDSDGEPNTHNDAASSP